MIESVETFLQIADKKRITDKEIYKLILEDSNYPVKELITSDQCTSNEDLIMRKLKNDRGRVQALALHDLFRQLSGNRQSINLVAAFHKQG